MKTFVLKNRLLLAGAMTGALAGLAWYQYVGCASGTCFITSNPLITTGYGAFLGGTLFNIFKKSPKPEK